MKKFLCGIFLLIGLGQAQAFQSQQQQDQLQECTQQSPCSALDKLERSSNLQRRQGESRFDFQTRILADIYDMDDRYQQESSEEFRVRVTTGSRQYQGGQEQSQ